VKPYTFKLIERILCPLSRVFNSVALSLPVRYIASTMSVKGSTIRYGMAAIALAIVIMVGSVLYLGFPGNLGNISLGSPSLLVIQLTDPPQVPAGTSSLNLSFSSLSLLVGEPSGTGEQLKTVTVTPSGGTATLDLLKLQNVSQTIGTATIPDGSTIYSVTFAISTIKLDANGSIYSVSLASGTSFVVTLANNPVLHGTNLALLRFEPDVVDTPSGYEMVPSSVGIIKPSEGGDESNVGYQHRLSDQDASDLDQARGSISANLLKLTSTGNVTTILVQVNNTGSVEVRLNALGFKGAFDRVPGCVGDITQNDHGGNDHSCGHDGSIVFVPLVPASSSSTSSTSTSSTTSRSCSSAQLTLGGNGENENEWEGLSLMPGRCVELSYSGVISVGESGSVFVPSTSTGQAFAVHVIVSSGAGSQLVCSLPLTANSCKQDLHQEH
jgi:hypothetical protein